METIIISRADKSYSDINNLIIVIASYQIALAYITVGKADYKSGDDVRFEGLNSGKNIRIPVHGPVEFILEGKHPDEIHLTIEDSIEIKIAGKKGSHKDVLGNICMPAFLNFYENNLDMAISRFSTGSPIDYNNWPASWRMGWVVRNALSHNKKISYSPKYMNSPEIIWRGATVSPKNQDEPLENIVNFADILILLLDMEKDLN